MFKIRKRFFFVILLYAFIDKIRFSYLNDGKID